MKIYAAAFSDRGRNLINQIGTIPLSVDYGTVPLLCGGTWVKSETTLRIRKQETLEQWTAEAFTAGAPLIFVGAAGIAVRAVAAQAASKRTDSPVLVVDEQGRFVIPLLSGHLGGANELAMQLAGGLGAMPVITTATDVNGVFAADVFARKNNLTVTDTAGIAKVSARLLRGEKTGVAVEGMERQVLIDCGLPENLMPLSFDTGSGEDDPLTPGIAVCSPENSGKTKADLILTTRDYVLGIGCKKGKSPEGMLEVLRQAQDKGTLRLEEVAAIASIDVKSKEPGLLELAQRLRRPFCVFQAKELMALPGSYTASGFVEQTVGVDNVCERAAAAAAGGGTILVPKTAGDGMTFALARLSEECKKKRRLKFHE